MNSHSDDELLQSLIDGELDPATTAATQRRLQQEPALARRHTELAAVRAAVDDALASMPIATLNSPASQPRPWWMQHWLAAAVALFSLAIVIAITVQDPDQKPAAWQDNELLGVRIVPHHGGCWPLFAPATFGLDLRAHGEHRLALRSWPQGQSIDDVAAAFAATSPGNGVLPFAIEATVQDPAGRRCIARLELGADVAAGQSVLVPLDEFFVQRSGLPPYFAVKPEGSQWKPDPRWSAQHFGTGEPASAHRLLLDDCGEWLMELRLVPLQPPAGARWLTYAAPLTVGTIVRCDGAATPWSEPVDFLQARLLLQNATVRASDGNPLLALQLRHESPRARHYNVVGITRADIPQPLHCQLLIDGKQCSQPGDVPLSVPAEMGFQPHEPGTTRTVVASLVHYRLDGKPLSSLRGRHRLAFRFAFTPTLWDGPADHYWMGEVTTPEIEVDFRD